MNQNTIDETIDKTNCNEKEEANNKENSKNTIDIDKISDKMESLGFEDEGKLKFSNSEFCKDINIDDFDFDVSNVDKPKYDLSIESLDNNVFNLKIPQEELDNAIKVMNAQNPDSIDAHPIALLYITSNSSSVNTINKIVDDKKFWESNYYKEGSDHIFTYNNMKFKVTPNR